MLSINCQGCKQHCCGQIPGLQPVLLPSEEAQFAGSTEDHGVLKLIKKKPDTGTCVFLDDKTNKCTIYNKRPLECRLYPFVLDVADPSELAVFYRLDPRRCGSLNTLIAQPWEIMKEVQKHDYPGEWVDAYEQLDQ